MADLANPFLDAPKRDPMRTYEPLSVRDMLAIDRAPKLQAGHGGAIDLSRARPGDVFDTDGAKIQIGPDGRPEVRLKRGYEDGRSAARAGQIFIPPAPRG
jgi:hypothetical protein